MLKINRKIWKSESHAQAQKEEIKELKKLSYQQKSSIITFLRENYYGQQASTGRVQRIFTVSKRK